MKGVTFEPTSLTVAEDAGSDYGLNQDASLTIALTDDGSVTETVNADDPVKPTNFTAAPGNAKVVLNWDNPSDSDIDEYEIRYKAGTSFGAIETGTGVWSDIANSSASTTSHTITGLTNGTEYVFQVRAVDFGDNNTDDDGGDDDVVGTASDTVTSTPDGTAPTVLVQVFSSLDRCNEFVTRIIFSEVISGFTAGDIGVTNATVSNFQNSADPNKDRIFAAKITPTNRGDLTVSVAAAVATDAASNENTASVTVTKLACPLRPGNLTATASNEQVALSWNDPSNNRISGYETRRKAGSGIYTIWSGISGSSATTTSHTVTGLTNGTVYTIELRAVEGPSDDEKGTTASVTATPAGLTLTGSIADQELTQGTAYTSATVFPVAMGVAGTISYSVANLPNGITLGSDRKLTSTATVPLAKTQLTYTATGDGTPSIAADSVTLPFMISVKPKAVTLTGTAAAAQASLTWTTIDGVTKWQVQRDGGSWTDIDGSGATTASHTITGLTNGTAYKFKVRAVVGTNNNAVAGVASNEVSVTPEGTAPTVVSIVRKAPADERTNAGSLTWRVTFSEKVKDVGTADFTVGGTMAAVNVKADDHPATEDDEWDVTVSGNDLENLNGTVTLGFASDQAIKDLAENPLVNTVPSGANDNSYVLDNAAPTVVSIVRKTPTDERTNASSLTWRVTFSEKVKDVETADFTVGGTMAAVIVEADDHPATEDDKWDVTVSGDDLKELNGTVTLSFVSDPTIKDLAENPLVNTVPSGANDNSYILDNTAPTVTIKGVPATASRRFTAIFTFSEPVIGFEMEDITVIGGSKGAFNPIPGDEKWTLVITPTDDYSVSVAAGMATDTTGNGNEASGTVTGTYSTLDPAERRVLKETLTGVARATLRGATTTLRQRFEALPGTMALTLDRERISLIGTTTGIGEVTARSADGVPRSEYGSHDPWSLESRGRSPWSTASGNRVARGDTLLGQSAFALPFGADGTGKGSAGPGWTVWGRGDFQQFDGKSSAGSHDGSLRSGWLGVDAHLALDRFVGMALSRSRGEADYSLKDDTSAGALETSLTALWAYLQLGTQEGPRFRFLAGAGTGEVEHRSKETGQVYPASPVSERADLSMRLASVSGQWPWSRSGAVALSLTGDAGYAHMETDGSGTAIAGLDAGVWQLRAGVEAKHDGFALDGNDDGNSGRGLRLSPFGSVLVRHDGGDGMTGTGVEIKGGFTLGAPGSRFSVDARGRWLAVHSTSDARLGPRPRNAACS